MTQVKLDQFDNAGYRPGSTALRSLWYVAMPIFLSGTIPWPYGVKRATLRLFGAHVGRGVVIKPHVRIKYPWKLSVGNHSWIGESVWIDNLDQVTIGHHCCISQGALLLCGNHDYTSSTFDLITRTIVMEDGSWVGAKSILGPGSVLGKEAVLAVGSVGLGHLQPHHIHQGNPAKPIRPRDITP